MKEFRILEKNLIIRASAGSGKTYQLGNRVIGLLSLYGADGKVLVEPESIVALTFTRKAAGEFADSVLSKLAAATMDPNVEAQLSADVGVPVNAMAVLERVVRALPRFQLGTLDRFFVQVVRSFQFELGLTTGEFQLLQGASLTAAQAEVRDAILGDDLDPESAENFLQAYRRATMGREPQAVSREVEEFFNLWHERWRSGEARAVWGQEMNVKPSDWEAKKEEMVAALERGVENDKVMDLLQAFREHTVGSGHVASEAKTLLGQAVEQLDTADDVVLTFRKKEIARWEGAAARQFRKMVQLLVDCEMSAARDRTSALLEVVACYDRECERRLRRRGRLGFSDIKILMGQWVDSEFHRLRREQIDFRLDARYHHWMLDEFQDTSRGQWHGLQTLMEEAISDEQKSLFIVGDIKQAIYGWRGGDAALFGEIRDRYGLTEHTMPVSWRSASEVLDLVNAVCGNQQLIRDLFGPALAARWQWEEHSAAKSEMRGESRVEVVGEDKHRRVAEILRDVTEGAGGRRDLSCAVLVRKNEDVRTMADFLRSEGFEVVEEGVRRPCHDHPVGVAMLALLRWLADPADRYAFGMVKMSPIGWKLRAGSEDADWDWWSQLMLDAQRRGFSAMMEELVSPLWDCMSDFGRMVGRDVIQALAAFDATKEAGARAVVAWLEDWEVAQAPGAAAVQVMTVHKSKGLGFDVVVLPALPDQRAVTDGSRYKVASMNGRVLQLPSGWVWQRDSGLCEAKEQWELDQAYEAMCLLYVAMTRAKCGLYVLLPEEKKSTKGTAAGSGAKTLANIVRQSVLTGAGDVGEILWQRGDLHWLDANKVKWLENDGPAEEEIRLRPASLRRRRVISHEPSENGDHRAHFPQAGEGEGLAHEIQQILDRVEWVDEKAPDLPDNDAGRAVAELFTLPLVRRRFERDGRNIQLLRKQAVEAVVEEKWLSGFIDRLHLWDGGKRVEMLVFVTTPVSSLAELKANNAATVQAYREAVRGVYPQAEIVGCLISTSLKQCVEM